MWFLGSHFSQLGSTLIITDLLTLFVVRLETSVADWNPCVKICSYDTIANIFLQHPVRGSQGHRLLIRDNTFSAVTTNACCQFHQARTTFTTADCKVAKSARCCPPGPSRCFATWLMVSWAFFSLLCHFSAFVLLSRVSARCFQSSRPDTASFRSCLKLPPGFFDMLEAGICARSRACYLFLRLFNCLLEP